MLRNSGGTGIDGEGSRPRASRSRRPPAGNAEFRFRGIRTGSDTSIGARGWFKGAACLWYQDGGRARALEDSMQAAIDIEVTPLSDACGAEIKGVDLTRPLTAAIVGAIGMPGTGISCWFFAARPSPRTTSFVLRPISANWATARKRPEPLRSRAEGIQQDNQKILLVSNVKVDGKPIGAFGEGEFWFHIDGGYTPRPYRYTFLYAMELPSKGGNTLFGTCTRLTPRCPRRSRRSSRAARRSISTNTTAPGKPAVPAISAAFPTMSIRSSSPIRKPAENPLRRPADDDAHRRHERRGKRRDPR